MGVKTQLISLIRTSGLSSLADQIRYRVMRIKNQSKNKLFKAENPNIPLPPPYMVYESFQMDYRKYFTGGKEDAEWIISLTSPYSTLNHAKILDWGCGPARIIRHLPQLLGPTNKYFGTDYNAKTISWCKQYLGHSITFSQNELSPPLHYPADEFDLIYGISILTHLSEKNHYTWINELFRIISPTGVVMLTTHGDAFVEKLTSTEAATYHDHHIVSRSKTKEGHRTFGSFHPPAILRNIFEHCGFKVVEHLPGKRITASYISQDVWILKK